MMPISNVNAIEKLTRKLVGACVDTGTPRTISEALCCLAENYGGVFEGKYFSILGDSISTYAGYIPEGNKVYYTGDNAGVDDVSQTWWSIVGNTLGMNLAVNNSWSGSKVSDIDASTQDFTPMSDVARCQALHKESEPLSITISEGEYYSVADGKVAKAANSNYKAAVIDVNAGESYAINLVAMSANAAYITAADDDGNVVASEITGNGSTVAYRDYIFKVPDGATKLYLTCRIRASALDDDLAVKSVIVPDVIFFWGGANDFSKANAAIGTWEGGAYPTTASTFSDAYALTIKRMQEKYPAAKIYCLSFPMITRTKSATNGTEYNSENKTIADYNAVIKKMCELFACQYIDVTGCGITRFNAYPTYCQDSATVPLHPNKEGMKLYATKIIREIEKS